MGVGTGVAEGSGVALGVAAGAGVIMMSPSFSANTVSVPGRDMLLSSFAASIPMAAAAVTMTHISMIMILRPLPLFLFCSIFSDASFCIMLYGTL